MLSKIRLQAKKVMNINFLIRKFYTLKMQEEKDVEKNINKLRNL
jgi:hypothetical protein